MGKGFSIKGISVLAAAAALALVATPMVIGAGNALATTDRTEAPALRASIAPVEPVQAAPEACPRKVRVVYSGYGTTPAAACLATR